MTTDVRREPAEPLRPQDHADAAAEAIRALNHATICTGDPAGYQWPSDVDAVIGSLQLMAQYLPQALGQAQDWLYAQHQAGRVGHDTPGRKVGFEVGMVVGHLDEAIASATALADAFAHARRESSHLTGVPNGPDTDHVHGAVEGGEA